MASLKFLVLGLPGVLAGPTFFNSNSTGPSEPSFYPDPSGRGTIELVLSCVLTLIICVWTVVHLNIIPNVTGWRYLGFKLMYLLVGLFAPEVLLGVAVVEFVQARHLKRTAKYAAAVTETRKAAIAAEKKALQLKRLLKAIRDVGLVKDENNAEENKDKGESGRVEAENSYELADNGNNAEKEIDNVETHDTINIVGEGTDRLQVANTLREQIEEKELSKLIDRLPDFKKTLEQNDENEHWEFLQLRVDKAAIKARKAARRALEAAYKVECECREARAADKWKFEFQMAKAVLDEKKNREKEKKKAANADEESGLTSQADATISTNTATATEEQSHRGGEWTKVNRLQKAALKKATKAVNATTSAATTLRRIRREINRETRREIFRYWFCRTVAALPFMDRFVAWVNGLIPDPDSRDFGFGYQGSFFAVMGGYTFLPLPKGGQRVGALSPLTLSANGVAFLLRMSVLRTEDLAILKAEVVDKGKSDLLAKILVCAQALWMVINCLCRRLTGLPVTLIELNVVMHVICAVVLYVLWLRKPHDAGRAISLSDRALDSGTCALLAMTGETRTPFRASKAVPGPENHVDTAGDPLVLAEKPEYTIPKQVDKRLKVYGQYPKRTEGELGRVIDFFPESMSKHLRKILSPFLEIQKRRMEKALRPDGVVLLFSGQTVIDRERGFAYTHGTGTQFQSPLHLNHVDLNLLAAAADELRSEKRLSNIKCVDNSPYPLYPMNESLFNPWMNLMLLPGVTSWERGGPLRGGFVTIHRIWLAPVVIVALTAFYGAAHVVAWDSHFPTITERSIWRFSCLFTALPAVIAIIIIFLAGLVATIDWLLKVLASLERFSCTCGFWRAIGRCLWFILGPVFRYIAVVFKWLRDRWMKHVSEVCRRWIGYALITLLVVVLTPVFAAMLAFGCAILGIVIGYICARMYIVVESFISVRSLPIDSFKTVRWSDIWPHL